LFVLAANVELFSFPRRWALPVAVLWTGILLTGLVKVSKADVDTYLYNCRMWGVVDAERLRAFEVTGDPGWVKDFKPVIIPDWAAPWPTNVICQPTLASILPPDVRKPLRLESDDTLSAQFFPQGSAPDKPGRDFTRVWGDYTTNPPAASRIFISQPMSASMPKLILELATGPATREISVQLVSASGHIVNIKPEKSRRWQTLVVDAPGNPFRLEIKDQSTDSWVAVGDIKEFGRFSGAIRTLVLCAAKVLLIGLGICVLLAFAGFMGPGVWYSKERLVWLLFLLVLLASLAGAWRWRNFDTAEYAGVLNQKWAAEFLSEGQTERAALHLHEALWLNPDSAAAAKSLAALAAPDRDAAPDQPAK